MTNDVDIVVLGRPTSVTASYDPAWVGDQYLVNFTVDEVIKGDLSTDMTGVLRLSDWYGDFAEDFDAPIPSTTTLLFARNMGLREQDPGMGGDPVPGDEFRYYLPSNYQNVYPELNGKVFITYPNRIADWIRPGEFPLALEGTSFEALVAKVRQAAAHPESADGAVPGSRAAC